MLTELPRGCCPKCSHLKSQHPELLNDVLVFPTIIESAPSKDRRYRDGKWRVTGCVHMREVFGPWPDQLAAAFACEELFNRLRKEKEAAR